MHKEQERQINDAKKWLRNYHALLVALDLDRKTRKDGGQ
jgi:hypothetical protein